LPASYLRNWWLCGINVVPAWKGCYTEGGRLDVDRVRVGSMLAGTRKTAVMKAKIAVIHVDSYDVGDDLTVSLLPHGQPARSPGRPQAQNSFVLYIPP